MSSQGSDALVHSLPGLRRGNFSIVTTSRRVSNRHTVRSEAHTRPSDPAHGNLARLHDPERLFKPTRQQPQLPARHPHTHHRSGVVTILAPRASAQRAHEPEDEEVLVPLDPPASRPGVYGVTRDNITRARSPACNLPLPGRVARSRRRCGRFLLACRDAVAGSPTPRRTVGTWSPPAPRAGAVAAGAIAMTHELPRAERSSSTAGSTDPTLVAETEDVTIEGPAARRDRVPCAAALYAASRLQPRAPRRPRSTRALPRWSSSST